MTVPARIVVLGIFATDLSFSATRLPLMGETILGKSFQTGPGGKGANQVVAARRAGADAFFITRLGQDNFGDLAMAFWQSEGVDTRHVVRCADAATGAAFIFVDAKTAQNAIIVSPGACQHMTADDVVAAQLTIAGGDVFLTQLEAPIAAVSAGLKAAHDAGICTVFNPAPALPFPPELYRYTDYLTPNESEASALTGVEVTDRFSASEAAAILLKRGARNVVITLGGQGAYFANAIQRSWIPAFTVSNVIDTTGAGDAFNGAFSVAIAEGVEPINAVRFGCACGALSITKKGTAPSMPTRAEIEQLLQPSVARSMA